MKIHHVGYLVKDLQAAMEEFTVFGGVLESEPIIDGDRRVKIAFVRVGELLVELVEPGEECVDIGEGLKRIGNMPYHICFECEDLLVAVEQMENCGCVLVREPQQASALGNRRVAFLYSGNLGLFEMVEMG